jgi:hypothetical protein
MVSVKDIIQMWLSQQRCKGLRNFVSERYCECRKDELGSECEGKNILDCEPVYENSEDWSMKRVPGSNCKDPKNRSKKKCCCGGHSHGKKPHRKNKRRGIKS